MRAIRQDTREKMYCDICGPNVAAFNRCLDCEENMCRTCCYVHEKSKLSRHHRISDLGTMQPEMKDRIRQRLFCVKHLEEELKLFCKDCKTLMCVMCKAIKHENHTSETVSDAAVEVKRNIQIKMNQCSDKVKRITNSEREADTLDKTINDTERKEIEALEDQHLLLINVIDQEVAIMKEKIENVYKDLRQQHEAVKRGIEEEFKKCSAANDNARHIIDQGTDIDVIQKDSELQQLLSAAMEETFKNPLTRMDKDMFSPVEIKVRELISLIGMMQDSTEISV
ncbi:hypothetical protein ACJMK2_002589, partial [Sinanodonta woodiana]